MAIWAIYAFDNFFNGSYNKKKIVRGTLEHAYEVGRSMSRDIIDSTDEILFSLEQEVVNICLERYVPLDSSYAEEIRNIVFLGDEAWECHELDEERLPKVDLETLNYIYEKEGYKFIAKFEVS